jgi:hypothetical protein
MRIYVNNVSKYAVNAHSLSTPLTLPSGTYPIVIEASDSAGAVYKSTRTIKVEAVELGELVISPDPLNFGSVRVGSSALLKVTVTADTKAAINISRVSTTARFAVSGLALPLEIAAGKSASFDVEFTPTASGSVDGTLSVVSNATNSTATVALSGTGTGATTSAHSVALSWTDKTAASVKDYNVFRATQSNGPYTILTGTPVKGTAYTDSTVSGGETYYYVATAISDSGEQSAYSAPVKAVVP